MSAPATARPAVTVVGAGLAGALMGLLLAREGFPVVVLERRDDPRREGPAAIGQGRSINLALAARGIAALRRAGVYEDVAPLVTAMPGRMLHLPDAAPAFVPYGQRDDEVIWSVSRADLNRVLVERLAALPGVVLGFGQELRSADFATASLRLVDRASGSAYRLPLRHVIGADGAGSPLRHALAAVTGGAVREAWLDYGYRELRIPPDALGDPVLDPNALHIWPRGGFMLIALPNRDGSFTATLFLPFTGTVSFAALADPLVAREFFAAHFPDALARMPDFELQFADHPIGRMGTVHCDTWHRGAEAVLIGDAAHAIVPFHGQGMNCAFEDCVDLAARLAVLPWADACAGYAGARRPQTDAIAEMALENFVEMRDTVRADSFHVRRALAFELQRRFPEQFVPRYSMVMFRADVPYATAQDRGGVQEAILTELLAKAPDPGQIDFVRAGQLIDARLPPLARNG